MEKFRIFYKNRGVENSISCHFFEKLFYSLESLSFHLFFTYFEKLTIENFQFLTKIFDLSLWGRSTILTYRDLIDNHVNDESLIPSTNVIQITLTLKMTTAQVVERSVTVNKTVLFTTKFNRKITLNLLMKWLLGSNLSRNIYYLLLFSNISKSQGVDKRYHPS